MHKHGSRPRSFIDDGVKNWCRVWRFRCPACRKTFTRLPPFLLPFKRYIASEIEAVLGPVCGSGGSSRAPPAAEESTLRRWWNEYRRKADQWAGLLESRVYELSSQASSLVQLPTDPLRRLEKALSRLPTLPSRWSVLVKALHWVLSLHPLCVHWPGVSA